MVDLHCHILPAMDDGAADLAEAVEMARIAAADGIISIVATPHVNEVLHPPEEVRNRVGALNQKLWMEGVLVRVFPGADVNVLAAPLVTAGHTVNGRGYLLTEFPHSHLPWNARDTLVALGERGLRPIITHPERNPSVVREPGLLLALLDTGALVQITADSLTGGFGDEARKCAKYLLRKRAVHFIASDAHSAQRRRPVLSPAIAVAAKILGPREALRLVTLNPAAVLLGKPLAAPL